MSLTLLQSRPIPNATQVAKFLFFALIQKISNSLILDIFMEKDCADW